MLKFKVERLASFDKKPVFAIYCTKGEFTEGETWNCGISCDLDPDSIASGFHVALNSLMDKMK